MRRTQDTNVGFTNFQEPSGQYTAIVAAPRPFPPRLHALEADSDLNREACTRLKGSVRPGAELANARVIETRGLSLKRRDRVAHHASKNIQNDPNTVRLEAHFFPCCLYVRRLGGELNRSLQLRYLGQQRVDEVLSAGDVLQEARKAQHEHRRKKGASSSRWKTVAASLRRSGTSISIISMSNVNRNSGSGSRATSTSTGTGINSTSCVDKGEQARQDSRRYSSAQQVDHSPVISISAEQHMREHVEDENHRSRHL